MLATLVDAIPTGDDWLHEIKYDGYRMLCRIDKGKVRVFSRNGKEWTGALGGITDAIGELGLGSAWLDGEVAVIDDRGPDELPGTAKRAVRRGRRASRLFRVRPALPRRLRPAGRRARASARTCCGN